MILFRTGFPNYNRTSTTLLPVLLHLKTQPFETLFRTSLPSKRSLNTWGCFLFSAHTHPAPRVVYRERELSVFRRCLIDDFGVKIAVHLRLRGCRGQPKHGRKEVTLEWRIKKEISSFPFSFLLAASLEMSRNEDDENNGSRREKE